MMRFAIRDQIKNLFGLLARPFSGTAAVMTSVTPPAATVPAGALQGDLTARAEIRADFPHLCDTYGGPAEILRTITTELAKIGVTLKDAGTIHVAYPHKHPRKFGGHYNAATDHAQRVFAELRRTRPDINWILDDGLCETVHLDRSGNQTSFHALTGKQVYELDPKVQPDNLPFSSGDGRKEYFIIVDQCVEQGTTVANLMSFITRKGGHVLMAAAGGGSLAQEKPLRSKPGIFLPSLSGAFNDASRNTARLPELAEALARSAKEGGLNHTPDECLRMFENALNRHGNSVFALTNGECQRLLDCINDTGYGYRRVTFSGLIDGLNKQAPASVPASAVPQPS